MSSTIRVWNGNQYQDHTLENFGKSRIFIGSGSYCDIVIKAQGIEEQQGMLLNNNGEWFYQDSNSMSGTFLNGNRVTSHKLAVGDVLVLGEVRGENTICIEVKSIAKIGADQAVTDSQSVFGQATVSASAPASQSAFGQVGQNVNAAPRPAYGQNMQKPTSQQPTYGQNTQQPTYGQNTQQPSYGQGMHQTPYGQNTQLPTYGQGVQQPSYGQGMQQPTYGQNMQQSYQPQRPAGQQYPPQNRQSASPPQNNNGGSGKKTGLIIGIITGVAVIGITIAILFATGVFGGKKEETGSTFSGKVDTTESVITTEVITEASTEKPTEMTETPSTESSTEPATDVPDELDSEEIYKVASPSTVDIQVFNDYYGSQGTGFFEDEKGTVITNYHVIDGMYEGTVTTSDGKEHKITGVVGYDADLDIAILSTDVETSVPLKRKTDKVVTGEKVYALGSSQGYAGTFTEGIVSTAERIEDGHVYIQHSAPITNGNSGGPLLDKHGYVMGINNWVRLDGQNLNFAIPIDQVDSVSRSTSMTLRDVYARENGGTVATEPTEFGDGKTVVLDSLNGMDLQITVPEYAEVYEEAGEAEYTNEAGDSYLSVRGSLEEGEPGKTLDDMNSEIIERLEEILRESEEEEGMVFQDISSGSLLIGNETWYAYTSYGYMEDDDGEIYIIEIVFLVGQKNGNVGFVQLVSVFENNENLEENYDKFVQMEEEMMATIKL